MNEDILIDTILDHLAGWEVRTGKNATAIYLGWKTYHRLMMGISPKTSATLIVDETKRLRFCGIPVFKVDEEEHIQVAG